MNFVYYYRIDIRIAPKHTHITRSLQNNKIHRASFVTSNWSNAPAHCHQIRFRHAAEALPASSPDTFSPFIILIAVPYNYLFVLKSHRGVCIGCPAHNCLVSIASARPGSAAIACARFIPTLNLLKAMNFYHTRYYLVIYKMRARQRFFTGEIVRPPPPLLVLVQRK